MLIHSDRIHSLPKIKPEPGHMKRNDACLNPDVELLHVIDPINQISISRADHETDGQHES